MSSGRGDSQCAATLLLNEDGRVQAFDAEAERLFHCRAEDALGQAIWTLLPDFPRGLLRPGEAAANSQILRLDARPKDGSLLPVELALTRMRVGTERVWIGALCDLTRHRQAEDTLRRSEESFRSLFERAMIGIFQTSPDGHFLRANAELRGFTGIRRRKR